MKVNDASALFNELKDAYEFKLDELKQDGEVSTKKNIKRMFKGFVK
ncbi:hypothetical protein K7A37_21185 [Escherichia fergusonii]|nr:hypothetical protein [Escherichia fergusonii]EFL4478373.1 hypothetical protein [Escherichia fergusonii]MBY7447758.1 hypothetical protein [Escherichia fergusonii]MBY7556351.1 hypothetical protein [Escherichia fergusonii]MCP9676072.1 hypothetical protein [Escherichia fergusonii]